MRILDIDTDKSVDNVIVLLTIDEVEELYDGLSDLIKNIEKSNNFHIHITTDDYSKEITIALYKHDNLKSFSKRCQRLVEEDK